MAFGNRTAAQYDVGFNVELGKFRADMTAAEQVYERTTGAMSTDAIRLSVAQEKVNRAVDRFGPESIQARSATASLRAEQERLASQTRRSEQALQREERTLGRLTRGAVAGSGVFRGLGRSVAFASTAFLGGTGFVYAIRASINAAIEQDKILANLRNSLQAGGYSWDQYGDRIEGATEALKRQSAFDDEELYASLQLLIRGTHSVNRALNLNALAADVARGRNMDLVRAATLLVRVNDGQVGSLRRLGIEVTKGITGKQALIEVEQKYAGAAQAFANSAAGAQTRFNVAIGDTEKLIGRALLPAFTKLADKAADYLNNAQHQKEIQADVNEAVKEGTQIVEGLADGLRDVHAILGPVVEVMGGLKTVTEALFGLWLLRRISAVARGLGLIKTNAYLAAGGIAAMDAASAGGGGVGPRTPGSKGTKIPFVPGINVPTAVVGAILAAGGDAQQGGTFPDRFRKYPLVYYVISEWDKATPAQQAVVLAAIPKGHTFLTAPEAKLAIAEAWLKKGNELVNPPPAKRPRGAGGADVNPPRYRARPLTPQERITIRLARAPEGSDEQIAAMRAQIQLDQGTIRFAEKLLREHRGNTEQLTATLDRLYSQDRAYEDRIDSILDQRIRDKQARANKRRQKLEKARKQEEAADRKAALLSNEPLPPTALMRGLADATWVPKPLSGVNKSGQRSFANEAFDFLTNLHGFDAQFGSSVWKRAAPMTVIVNQSFPTPTPDRNREAIYARAAMEHAFHGSN